MGSLQDALLAEARNHTSLLKEIASNTKGGNIFSGEPQLNKDGKVVMDNEIKPTQVTSNSQPKLSDGAKAVTDIKNANMEKVMNVQPFPAYLTPSQAAIEISKGGRA